MNFDKIIDRSNKGSLKWEKYAGQDILPMWVADMDFPAAQAISNVIKEEADHGIYGYAIPTMELRQTIVDRLAYTYNWRIRKDDIVFLPGVVCALNLACRATGEPGDEVLTTTPIYPPFMSAPGFSDRVARGIKLKETDQRWEMDFEAIEEAINEKSSLFLLCNPHNPVGRVYSKEELQQLADLCLKNDITICSDEIHCDLVLDKDLTHYPMASLSDEIAQNTITLMAPSKTFNLPGLACSFAVIQNPALRLKFQKKMRGIVPDVNSMGLLACQAAYDKGEEWRLDLIDYLKENSQVIDNFLAENCPQIKMAPAEATYLAWLDVSALGLDKPAQHFENHGIGLSDGKAFGLEGYLRLNFACPRSILMDGLERFLNAVEAVKR